MSRERLTPTWLWEVTTILDDAPEKVLRRFLVAADSFDAAVRKARQECIEPELVDGVTAKGEVYL